MDAPKKPSKTAQNGKGPPVQESENNKLPNQASPQSKNTGRRRGRGGRKLDQGDAFMRPSSRPYTVANKPAIRENGRAVVPAPCNGSVGNEGGLCESNMGFPGSSKSLTFPVRPGFGQLGRKCLVKANHFFVDFPGKDLNQYDVTISPEVTSKAVNRAIIAELVKLYKESELGMILPAYDGGKRVYSSGELPFVWKEFTINLIDEEDNIYGPKREWEYNVVIKFVTKAKEALQILDIVLRECSMKRFCPVGRSFFSPDVRKPQRLGDGLEAWCGFYQSIRLTQMGLSLNIDMASAAFIEALPLIEFVAQLLGIDVLSRPLSDSDYIKVKKALRGVKVENFSAFQTFSILFQPDKNITWNAL